MGLMNLKRRVMKLAAQRQKQAAQAQAKLPPAKPPGNLFSWANEHLRSVFSLAPSPFHSWLAARLTGLQSQRGSHLNVLAPRGSGKSAWISLAYPLWCGLHGLEPYILLLSDTSAQATKFLEAIKQELEENSSLQHVYPKVARQGPVWRKNEIRLCNGVSIEALGTGSKIRGRKNRSHRPSLVIIDDPQNGEHVSSAPMRERSWSWLTRDVLSVGDPSTNYVVLGTALHRECIVCKMQQMPGWESHVFRSIMQMPKRMDLWREWEDMLHNYEDDQREQRARAFYQANRKAMDK
jgi:hypothetical protein